MSSKMRRIQWIDEQIRANRYPNAHKVQEHFELRSHRVVYDDRNFMIDELHAPIKYSKANKGWHYTDPTYFLPAIMLKQEEVAAFFLGEELFKRYLGTPLRGAASTGARQDYAIPAETGRRRRAKGRLRVCLHRRKQSDYRSELLMTLGEASLSKHSVEMEYYSASRGQTNTRTVDPYHLHNIHGDWYLIAYCHTRREPRDFLVSRIKSYKRLSSAFQIHPSFSLDAYLSKGFLAERGTEPEDVVIKFDEYQARWIRERRWHPSQRIEELPCGGLILRMRVGGLGEVKRWVMGYGNRAEVLQPERLRREIADDVKKMSKIYEKL